MNCCMHVFMYACIYVWMNCCMHVFMYVWHLPSIYHYTEHWVSWGLPSHQMFVLYLRRNDHIVINNIMRITFYLFLKHFSVNLFMWRHFETSSSRLFNKLAEFALATSNFSRKHKSHFLVPQMYGCAFIAINQSIV